jgi:predicted peptidase
MQCASWLIAAGWFGVLSGSGPAWGAETKEVNPVLLERFEARVSRDAEGRTLRYRLFKPPGATTNLPLVLFFHGAAGLGDDNVRQFNGGNEVPPGVLTAPENQARFPCFVLAPQCPRTDSWGGSGTRVTPTLRMTLALLDTLPREFPIDRRRLYVVGVSMGGRGVWETVLHYPDTFAAAVPICAAGEPEGLGRIQHLPVWCFHGADDPTVPVSYARRMMAALRKAGGHPKYTEYPGVGHDSYRNAFREPELLPWLFAQRRSG